MQTCHVVNDKGYVTFALLIISVLHNICLIWDNFCFWNASLKYSSFQNKTRASNMIIRSHSVSSLQIKTRSFYLMPLSLSLIFGIDFHILQKIPAIWKSVSSVESIKRECHASVHFSSAIEFVPTGISGADIYWYLANSYGTVS